MAIRNISKGMDVAVDKNTGRTVGIYYNDYLFLPSSKFKSGTKFIKLKFRIPGNKTIFVRPLARQ